MARPIEFVYDDVIARATNQFWKDGFVASSVQKLLDTTRINRGTMYNSFGEKEVFFRTCVGHYNAMLQEHIAETLGNTELKAGAAVRAFFQMVVTGVPMAQRHYGCLLVNSLCESINWDDQLSKLIRDSLQAIRKPLLARARELEKSRGLTSGVAAEFAAEQLMHLYEVTKLNARAGKSPRLLLDHINFLLAALIK